MKRTAIITGSNRGIGKALVKAFAENDYDVWACARRPSEDFERDIEILKYKTGAIITPVYFDLRDSEETKEGIRTILREKRKVDVLINNAGIPYGAHFAMTSIDKLREIYEINVFAQIQIMQLVARKMIRQNSGCIINMCSVGGIETNPGYLAYGSSKAALIWITKAVSRELGTYNIRVNGIAPGLIDTDMGHYKSEEERAKVLSRMSLNRIGRPEEIASAALYIASEEASYMTGHILVLDGGRV